MTTPDENKELVRRFVQAVNSRDHDALDAVVRADYRRICPATPDVDVQSLDDFKRFLEADLQGFPDSVVTLDALVAEEDHVGFWATYRGTQMGAMGTFPATGKPATAPFAGVFRIQDGMIAETRLTWDNLAVLRQLGHLE